MNNIFYEYNFKGMLSLREKIKVQGFLKPIAAAKSEVLFNDSEAWKKPEIIYTNHLHFVN